MKLYRMDGTPYPEGNKGLFEWAEDMKKLDRRIQQTTLNNGLWISTVWLGLDHNYWGGIPLIFESMVFNKERESLDCERYPKWMS